MIDRSWAETFAKEWVDAWNSHDLERILSHYRDDFQMTSPLIVARMGVKSGTLNGKEAVRKYWSQGLEMTPDLHFDLSSTIVGVNSIAIIYRSVTAKRVEVEILEFDEARKVIRAEALHGSQE